MLKFCIIFCIFSWQIFFANISLFSKLNNEINESDKYYVIIINVEEFGVNFKLLKENAIRLAKRKAFVQLKYDILKLPNLELTDFEIDSYLSFFSTVNEDFKNSLYNGVFKFYFDKSLIKDLILDKAKNYQNNAISKNAISTFTLYIAIDNNNIAKQWLEINTILKENNINFMIYRIDNNKFTMIIKNASYNFVTTLLNKFNIK